MATEFKYWAFISYSHRDNRKDGNLWGDWLHDAVENFKVPAELVGKPGRYGEPIPARLYPAFQDEKELPTNADLGIAIKEALEQSRYLVVICSPCSAKSIYVNQEVLEFKQLGRANRILAIIIDGEPNASEPGKGFDPALECFPEALRHPLGADGKLDLTQHAEPIAADVRGNDGKEASLKDKAHQQVFEREKLRVMAGLMGVGFDDLVQRDKERQLLEERARARRLKKLVAGFAALATVAIVAGVFALVQKQKADQQRQEAEKQREEAVAQRHEAEIQKTNALAQQKIAENQRQIAETEREEADREKTNAIAQQKIAEQQTAIATAQKKIADEKSQEAEAQKTAALQTLSQSDFLQAEQLIAGDKPDAALAYLSQSLTANPENEGALTRLATCLTEYTWEVPTLSLKHDNGVLSAQFSSDGKRIVTASYDKTARVWDAQTGQPLTPPMKHDGFVLSAQFSPDGRRIVTASEDKTARVWDAQTGQPLTPPMKHDGWVLSAQFSPDGRWIVTASEDKTARVWDAQTGQPLTPSMKHNNLLRSAQFSPDGRRIVTASEDKTARVWDAQTGQPLTPPMKHDGFVWSAQFSPDGKRIVTASWDETARVWDAQTGQPLTPPMKHNDAVESAQFSNDGTRIVTASHDETAQVWDAQTGQPLTPPMKHDGYVNYAQFSPDGTRIVTASWDETARVWDAQTGQPLTPPMKHDDIVNSAQFSPDGKWIVTASDDHTARIWDAQTGQPLTLPIQHDGGVNSAQFSPDGKQIVTASDDKTARVWDIAPVSPQIPDWLLPLAEALSGQVLNNQSVLEQTKLDRGATINHVRQELNQSPANDDWTVWGRWFLADPTTRTVSPFSRLTVPQYIEECIQEDTTNSLNEAESLVFGDTNLLARISAAHEALEDRNRR